MAPPPSSPSETPVSTPPPATILAETAEESSPIPSFAMDTQPSMSSDTPTFSSQQSDTSQSATDVAPQTQVVLNTGYRPSPKSKLVFCPFCQNEIGVDDLNYVCSSEKCKGITKQNNVDRQNPHCSKEVNGKICNEILVHKVCPCCGDDSLRFIPREIYESSNLCTTVTLIGNSGSGKTTFLRQLFPYLRDTVGFNPFDNKTNSELRNEFIKLDQFHNQLSPTDITTLVALFIKTPGPPNKAVNVTFFDIAGEHIQDTSSGKGAPCKAMLNAENIIFLIDADYFTESSPTINDPVSQFVTFITQNKPKPKGLFQKSWLHKIKIAVAVTKLDKYKADFEGTPLVSSSANNSMRSFDYEEVEKCKAHMENWLRTKTKRGGVFLDFMADNFKNNYELFGIFPLGLSPVNIFDENGMDTRKIDPDSIGEPIRIADPVLWLLN
jgi:energy-coupling factor transporter ATP-binding protein EcfA2